MKTHTTFCWLILISFTHLLNAQIYVKADASGTNNGSSWTDAFTNLSTAIDSAKEGDQIWVASGIYLPGTTPDATFTLNKNLRLYGGFAGVEDELGEREEWNHQPILSGDLLGDDISGNWFTNKSDNARTVLTLSSTIDSSTIIDGFIIQNGYADTSVMIAGGIDSRGSPIIRNCQFSEHFSSNLGAAMRFDGPGASDALVEYCIFDNNKTNGYGAGIAVEHVSGTGPTIHVCLFEDNYALEGGGGLSVRNSDLLVKECEFKLNNADAKGGGLFCLQTESNRSLSIDDCLFQQNASTLGGAVYAESKGDDFSFQLHNSQFVQNLALSYRTGYLPSGGGLHLFFDPLSWFGHAQITACQFEANAADRLGGGMSVRLSGPNASMLVDRSVFKSNTIGNLSSAGGAGMYTYSNQAADIQLKHSDFLYNTGGNSGALTIETGQNGDLNATIDSCHFTHNSSLEYGAGMTLFAFPGAISATHLVEHCSFERNHFPRFPYMTYGGGICVASAIDDFQASIRNSEFINNHNLKGGASIQDALIPGQPSPELMELLVENCLFTQHDSGHAVLQFDHINQCTLSNITTADNWMSALKVKGDAFVQVRNSILNSPFYADVQVESNAILHSLGGNLISDSSASISLTTQDIVSEDPGFVKTGEHPYQVHFTSPAVDLGLMYPGFDPLATDMAGNPRYQGASVDAGAYESPYLTSIKDQLDQNASLSMYPNPVVQQATLELENNWTGQVQLRVYNSAGQLVQRNLLTKDSRRAQWDLRLGQLAAGTYRLVLTDGESTVSKSFVKRGL